MPPDFDYRGWVERAKLCAERARRLPGEVHIEADVSPPMGVKEVDSLAQTLPRGIPEPIRRFLTQGSADCHCRYWWDPFPNRTREMTTVAPSENLVPFASVFPRNNFIYGGADLCNPINRGIEDLGKGIASVKRAGFKMLQTGCADLGDAMDSPDERKLFQESIPFLSVGNGDTLALNMARPDLGSPVVYLSHEGEGISCYLSPSFEDFLEQWELLCYVGPEIWLLSVFQDPKTGFISGQCDKAVHLREMFHRLLV